VIPVSLNQISITYNQPITVSNKNVTIYQYTNGMSLLRQSIPGNLMENLKYSDDRKTIFFNVLNSTFNQAESDYSVVVDDDAVKALGSGQPLLGIGKGILKFKTGMY
jgi:archaellin